MQWYSLQIAGSFVILMQLIAEPCYNVYFHNWNTYPVPAGVCYGESTPLQLLIWAQDTNILLCWEHLSFHMPAGCRLQSWKVFSLESSGETLSKVGEHWASCTRTGGVRSLQGPIQGQGRRSVWVLCLWPAHGSWVRPAWLGAAGPNRCSWSRAASPWVQAALHMCPSPSAHHLAGMSSGQTCFLLKGTAQPEESRFGPIALLWLPKSGYNAHWLTFAEVGPACWSWLQCWSSRCTCVR